MAQLARPDLPRRNSGQDDLRAGSAAAAGAHRPVPGWAVVSALLTPAVLVSGWLLADALQPRSYSPMHQTMSVMAGQIGSDRWVMNGALAVVGLAQLGTGIGLTAVRWPARLLLILAGLSTLGVTACPVTAAGPTPLHLLFAVICVVATAAWPVVAAWKAPGQHWVLGLPAAGVVTAVFAGLCGWLLVATQGGADLGLAERLTSSAQACWPFVVAVALWLTTRNARYGEAAAADAQERVTS